MSADRILICGTGSNVGKSLLVTGLCRSLVRRGRKVAPFKAQNMSLNSFVTREGGEIGRAQAAQAYAARLEPHIDMNPVLLKPGAEMRSQVIVLGQPLGERDAQSYQQDKGSLRDVVVSAFERLATSHDIVVAEGAGSAAELNLREGDIVNLGLARAVGAPVLVVGDIDRGGVFAAFLGTLAALDEADARHVKGFVINRFRGDARLLDSGIAVVRQRTGRAFLGVVPERENLLLDAEDSLAAHPFAEPAAPMGPSTQRVGVVAYPHLSNLTDIDPLACEPGVVVRMVRVGEEVEDIDLLIMPGTRATVSDLEWLRRHRFVPALEERQRAGLLTIGLCGGFQMLGQVIVDDVESGAGQVLGLGLLPVTTRFYPEKYLRQHHVDENGYSGYEIRHGRSDRHAGEPFVADQGCRVDGVVGTSWHGIFENDGLRREVLREAAERSNRSFVAAADTVFGELREAYYERVADLVDEYLDIDLLESLAAQGIR